jgi:single-strand DNA-binding protein
MYHEIIIVGHLGRDPEMRYTDAGLPVTTFSMATNRKWTNDDGSQGEETIWVRVTAWRKLAEVCNQYLKKGRLVLVKGHLQPDKATGGPRVYQRKDGAYSAQYEMVAETVRFLGGNGKKAEDEEPIGAEDDQGVPF